MTLHERSSARFVGLAALAISLGACSVPEPETRAEQASGEPAALSTELAPEHRAALAGVAAEYRDWGRVDDLNHWAPELCRLAPGKGRLSEGRDQIAHGRKLYYLYARDRDSYVDPERTASPVGQVIVKESWHPEPVGPEDEIDNIGFDQEQRLVAERDGLRYRAASLNGLFVMMKLEPGTPGTDEGWVYGTTDAAGNVLEAGRIASCMDCHSRPTRVDRLFGVDLTD